MDVTLSFILNIFNDPYHFPYTSLTELSEIDYGYLLARSSEGRKEVTGIRLITVKV